ASTAMTLRIFNQSSFLNQHFDSLFRPKCDRRYGPDRLSRHEFQSELLRHRRQQQYGFHQRKRIADAQARAAAEREISVSRQLLRKFLSPPPGDKLVRPVEEARVALHDPLEHINL